MPDVHPDELAFLAKIADHPDYPLPRLVFADWLEERGDPRAAWVRDDDLWEWMKPDAHDPIPGILAALPAPRIVGDRERHEEAVAKASAALRKLEPTSVDAVRDWLLANRNHWPAREVQDYVSARPPSGLRSVRTLRAKLKGKAWVELWLAIIDLGFHGPNASPAVPALLKVSDWDRGDEMSDSLENADHPIDTAIHRTLGKIGPAALKAVPWLASSLWVYQDSIEEALLSIRPDAELVVEHLNTHDDWELMHGLSVAEQLTDNPVGLLIRTARQNEGRLCWCSIYRLGEMGPAAAKAVPELVELSQLQNRWDAEYVRTNATHALAQIRGEPEPPRPEAGGA